MCTAGEDSWSRGALIWAGLGVPREAFQAWLDAHPSADPAFAPDQYLVCACLQRIPGAIEAFSKRCLDPMDRHLGTLARTPDRVDEIRQALAVRLFVGDEGRAPALAEYGGQGSLEGWIRVSSVRLALMLERKRRPTAPIEAQAGRVFDAYDGELVYLRQRYRAHFKRALEVALAALDPTHRVMLRLHFVEGMTTAAMATLYQMSRATLVRRLSDAKTALREGVASEIARTVKVSSQDYEELLASVKSVLDVSIARLLGGPEGGEGP